MKDQYNMASSCKAVKSATILKSLNIYSKNTSSAILFFTDLRRNLSLSLRISGRQHYVFAKTRGEAL
jgi:hypothetical protein